MKLRQLHNSEYVLFVKQLINIINKYFPDALHLTRALGGVTSMVPQLEKIRAKEKRNALTQQLKEIDKSRDNYIRVIHAQVKNIGKLNLLITDAFVKTISRLLEKYGHDLATANYPTESQQIIALLTAYNASQELKTAAEGLNIAQYFDALDEANSQFEEIFMARIKIKASTEKVDSLAIRLVTDIRLTEFYKAIEYCSREYDDLDYATPVAELNHLISYYKTVLKRRATRRKTRKNKKKDKPDNK